MRHRCDAFDGTTTGSSGRHLHCCIRLRDHEGEHRSRKTTWRNGELPSVRVGKPTREQLVGCRVKMLRTIENRGGQSIKKGWIAVIDGWHRANFHLRRGETYIRGVHESNVRLLGT